MKVLFVSATLLEVQSIKDYVHRSGSLLKNVEVEFLSTGVGAVATTYYLTRYLQNHKPSLIINVGIAGAYNKEVNLGSVFYVIQDRFADLGAEDGNKFLDLIDLGFQKQSEYPFQDGVINNLLNLKLQTLKKIPTARAITLNTASGNTKTIQQMVERFNPDLETMEGCACFYVARLEQVPVLQIRAISNHVEKRNRKNWQIELALQNLSRIIYEVLHDLDKLYGN